MSDCNHEHIVDPPPGKHLRICLDCLGRLIECSTCDAKLVAGPDVANSGWEKCAVQGIGVEASTWNRCPACQR